nr:MAG TPA: hypothetical protein [Caudoviricetes sp.]
MESDCDCFFDCKTNNVSLIEQGNNVKCLRYFVI